MNQPTFQQIGDLYHALWELQREAEEAEKTAQAYKEAYFSEEQFSSNLIGKINKACEYLRDGDIAKALEVLKV